MNLCFSIARPRQTKDEELKTPFVGKYLSWKAKYM